MTSINEVELAGHIGRDPDVRTVGDSTVHNFSIATQRNHKDRNGDWQTSTDWHKVTVWGISQKLAPAIRKGAKILVKGRLQTRSWDDQNGSKRSVTEVICNASGLMILGAPRNGNGDARPPEQSGGSGRYNRNAAPAQAPQRKQSQQEQQQPFPPDAGIPDDDIPFGFIVAAGAAAAYKLATILTETGVQIA